MPLALAEQMIRLVSLVNGIPVFPSLLQLRVTSQGVIAAARREAVRLCNRLTPSEILGWKTSEDGPFV